MPYNIPIGSRRYRALIAGAALDLTLNDRTGRIDGSERPIDLQPAGPDTYSLLVAGRSYTFHVERLEGGRCRVTTGGRSVDVVVRSERDLLIDDLGLPSSRPSGAQEVRAPMPGLVVSILTSVGVTVEAGAGLLVLEAMKMENELRAPAAARVRAIHVQPGDAVAKNVLLIELEPVASAT